MHSGTQYCRVNNHNNNNIIINMKLPPPSLYYSTYGAPKGRDRDRDSQTDRARRRKRERERSEVRYSNLNTKKHFLLTINKKKQASRRL